MAKKNDEAPAEVAPVLAEPVPVAVEPVVEPIPEPLPEPIPQASAPAHVGVTFPIP